MLNLQGIGAAGTAAGPDPAQEGQQMGGRLAQSGDAR